ncbi:hypothetical protein CLF_111952 [Clonorchis sinensis]|uniref:Uncharacterized protein n=1 Tax=Clonorchis sinensis TaxID=79923 RepID=G7YVL2_CLOSI|nr:hypothetical protein CLF_111952 [Clonorchis sinensis]
MKRNGAAHSVACKHHKREIQLGSSACNAQFKSDIKLTVTRKLRLSDELEAAWNQSWIVCSNLQHFPAFGKTFGLSFFSSRLMIDLQTTDTYSDKIGTEATPGYFQFKQVESMTRCKKMPKKPRWNRLDILKSLMERMTTMCVMQFHKNYPAFREYLKMDQVDEKLMKLGKILVARLNDRLNMLEKQGK